MSEPVGVKDLDAFFFDLTRDQFLGLMKKLQDRVDFLRVGEGKKGQILTRSARRYLIDSFRLNKEGDVGFLCALISLLRVARVKAVKQDLLELIKNLRGENCELTGLYAACALWQLGSRSKLIEPYISDILHKDMSRQDGRLFFVGRS